MPSINAAVVEPEPVKNASKKRLIDTDVTPSGALVWIDESKAAALHRWRRSVMSAFAERARALRVAWCLEWLFGGSGYCYASDTFLARETGLPRNKVQAALNDLERAGAIVRAHVVQADGQTQRRIFPAAAIAAPLHPTVGSTPTPQGGPKPHPTVGHIRLIQRAESAKAKHIEPRVSMPSDVLRAVAFGLEGARLRLAGRAAAALAATGDITNR